MTQSGITKKIFQSLAVILALAVFAPAVVKLSHVFNHHKHEVCETSDFGATHFHDLDVDCEFYKFKISDNYFFQLDKRESQTRLEIPKLDDSHELFLLPYQKITSYLRGPPRLV